MRKKIDLTEKQKEIVESYLLDICEKENVQYIDASQTHRDGYFIGILSTVLREKQMKDLIKMGKKQMFGSG